MPQQTPCLLITLKSPYNQDMQISLIQLHDGYHDSSGRYPLGLGYLAARLNAHGHEVRVIDFKFFFHSDADIVRVIKSLRADLIGLSGLISSYHYLKEIVGLIKHHHPQTPLVLGGPLSFTIEALILKHNALDAICVGEGEDTLLEMVHALEKNRDWQSIAGLWLPDHKGGAYATATRSQTENLDSIPFPAWHILNPRNYRYDPNSGIERPMSILASRGCPSSCDFCARVTLDRSIRYRSVDNVIQELGILYHDYGIRQFTFVDEYFTANLRWVRELCERIIHEKLLIQWNASSRVRVFDDPTYDLMQESGCNCLSFGVESADSEILKSYGKRQNASDTLTIFRKLNARGIRMNYLLISGAFEESPQTMRATTRLLLANGNPARFFFLSPLPGTPIYRRAQEQRLIQDEDAYLTKLSITDNTFEKLHTINLTKMPLTNWIELKQSCEQDSFKMFQIRNHIGIFGQYTWRLLAFAEAQHWQNALGQLKQNWRVLIEQIHYFQASYPDLKIDLAHYKAEAIHAFSSKPDSNHPLLPEALEPGLEMLLNNYGVFGEVMMERLLALPDSEWASPQLDHWLPSFQKILQHDLVLMADLSKHEHFLELNRLSGKQTNHLIPQK